MPIDRNTPPESTDSGLVVRPLGAESWLPGSPVKGSHWQNSSMPAANTLAIVTVPAVTGQRLVCRGLQATISSTGGVGGVANTRLRATTGGTVIFQARLAITVSSGDSKIFPAELTLVGEVGQNMVIEFLDTPGANGFLTISAQGYRLL